MKNSKPVVSEVEPLKIKNLKDPFWLDKFNITLLFSSLLVNFGIWIWLFFKIKPKEEPIPLHYNIYFGIDFIDKWYKVLFIPGLGLVFILINFILSYMIYPKEKIIGYLLLGVTTFIQILLLVASFCIILVQR